MFDIHLFTEGGSGRDAGSPTIPMTPTLDVHSVKNGNIRNIFEADEAVAESRPSRNLPARRPTASLPGAGRVDLEECHWPLLLAFHR